MPIILARIPSSDMSQLDDPKMLALAAGLFITGMLLGWLWANLRGTRHHSIELQRVQDSFSQTEIYLQQQILDGKSALGDANGEAYSLREKQFESQNRLGQLSQQVERIVHIEQDSQRWQDHYQQAQQQIIELRTQGAKFEQEQLASREKLALLESSEQRLQQQFENLANKIFEQKQTSFAQSSKAGLDALLSPLKEQIEGFKKQVNDQYVREGQERASLKTEIMGLKELNQQITHDAAALTKALKGDNKQQGNWGEVVLERILKDSGLREGHEFDTQVALKNAQGKSYQPDVVVHLPNDKDVVI
ncbi:MAG: DNA recombination protein RmuC, partial [Paraglaciecola sp.]